MNIQLSKVVTTTTAIGTYKNFTAIANGQEIQVFQFDANDEKYSNVNVKVKNAMHKAFRGFGKDFENIEQAISNYKSAKVVAALEAAKMAFNNVSFKSEFTA